LVENKLVATLLEEVEDPFSIVLIAILMGFTKSLWKVSGEGSGGVTRAFGEDFWDLIKIGSELLGEEKDISTPEKALEFYDSYLMGRFKLAEKIDFDFEDGTLKMRVTNCKAHHYTDYLEENDVPRAVGCPIALSCAAMLEEITGEPFIVDNITSNEGNSEIVLKSL